MSIQIEIIKHSLALNGWDEVSKIGFIERG